MTSENEIATSNYTNIPKRLEFRGGILFLVSPILKYSSFTKFSVHKKFEKKMKSWTVWAVQVGKL